MVQTVICGKFAVEVLFSRDCFGNSQMGGEKETRSVGAGVRVGTTLRNTASACCTLKFSRPQRKCGRDSKGVCVQG